MARTLHGGDAVATGAVDIQLAWWGWVLIGAVVALHVVLPILLLRYWRRKEIAQ